MAQASDNPEGITVLLLTDRDDRSAALRSQLSIVVPRASIETTDAATLAEGRIPKADVALIDAGPAARGATDSLRLLRARGFLGPTVVVTPALDDPLVQDALGSLGATCVARASVDAAPTELGAALVSALAADPRVSAELAHARRVYAAGQVALSLQHSINNPLAALLAEAQLLQMEDLTSEQRDSVDRVVELCRRVVALVRRLDALADG